MSGVLDLVIAVQGTGLELRPSSQGGKVVEWSVCYSGSEDMLFTGKRHQIEIWLKGFKAYKDLNLTTQTTEPAKGEQ